MTRIRIGSVGYLNALPLTTHLDSQRYEVIADHPRAVAQELVDGRVTLALAPVAAVLPEPGLRICGGLCIGAQGPVQSVLLVGDRPPEAWTDIVLDGQSRTSVILAQLLARRGPLSGLLSADIPWRTVAPGEAPSLAGGTTGAVIIGDPARSLPDRLHVRLDLAEMWTDWTGLPFVFAVWAGRPEVPVDVREDIVRAGRLGTAAVEQRWSGEDAAYLTRRIRYPFDDAAIMGLRRFAALAAAEGLIPGAQVRMYDPPRTARTRRPDTDQLLADGAEGRALPADAARLLLRHAPLSELGVAAQLARARRHGASAASFLLADTLDPAGPPAAWRALLDRPARPGEALMVDLSALEPSAAGRWWAEAAASSRQVGGVRLRPNAGGLPPGDAFIWLATDPLPLSRLIEARDAGRSIEAMIGLAGADDDTFLQELAAIATALRSVEGAIIGVSVHLPLPAGSLVDPAGLSPARWLRRVSVTRLVLHELVHVIASPATQGLDLCQLALAVGADDLGPIGAGLALTPDAEPVPDPLELAERFLRVGGWEPVRRDLQHHPIGGALTPLRSVRRPNERARL